MKGDGFVMRNKCYELYELRQLTQSILVLGQQMRCLKNNSIEYRVASEEYEKLWERRDEIENKIIGLCNDSDDENYWVI